MGFSISVKVSLPKDGVYRNKRWLDKISSRQRVHVVPQMRALFAKTVFGWSDKPHFGWTQTKSQDEIGITMYPEGPAANTWNLVSQGSPPHKILPKNGGFLRFRTGYRAATRPGSIMSQRAYRSGPHISTPAVNHPGFEARNFPELIVREYRREFEDEMQFAFNEAAKT